MEIPVSLIDSVGYRLPDHTAKDRIARQVRPAGADPGGSVTAESAVKLDPHREIGHRLLVEAERARGDSDAALRAFHRCERILAEEIGVRPSAETLRLADLVLTSAEDLGAPTTPSFAAPWLRDAPVERAVVHEGAEIEVAGDRRRPGGVLEPAGSARDHDRLHVGAVRRGQKARRLIGDRVTVRGDPDRVVGPVARIEIDDSREWAERAGMAITRRGLLGGPARRRPVVDSGHDRTDPPGARADR